MSRGPLYVLEPPNMSRYHTEHFSRGSKNSHKRKALPAFDYVPSSSSSNADTDRSRQRDADEAGSDEENTLSAFGDISLTADYESPVPSVAKPTLRPKKPRPGAPSKRHSYNLSVKEDKEDQGRLFSRSTLLTHLRTTSDIPMSPQEDMQLLIDALQKRRSALSAQRPAAVDLLWNPRKGSSLRAESSRTRHLRALEAQNAKVSIRSGELFRDDHNGNHVGTAPRIKKIDS
ncbi:hypothetical protein WOLCODRAFT_140048 [Wolfiporia cocos MD-104 SS10]|uniref:Uncharacterized protein n=1 Tax=Wolfiporia cocos (strain MD-104) TaxID=742152 RepID=A0A2H3J0F3_WOLCO|nr:hypothetical protein WOLCODRAFT_140048 [Wolfiporia cocos MD-104 SS10]